MKIKTNHLVSNILIIIVLLSLADKAAAQKYEYDDRFNTYANEQNTDSIISPVDSNSPLFNPLEREESESTHEESESSSTSESEDD